MYYIRTLNKYKMSYHTIREEELKNKIANEYFWTYDSTRIIGDVDFCISIHQADKSVAEQESLLWAEAKKGSSDIYKSFVQLILTIGKARTFDNYLPPPFLGAFDADNIAFIPYNDIHDVFYQNDCLAFTLFHGQNRISVKYGTNHWIPFTEQEVNAGERFESNFMSQFINGEIKPDDEPTDIFTVLKEPTEHYKVPLKFSDEAKHVFDTGRELWKYYHAQPYLVANASFYDIKEHFQGRNDKGKMNHKSNDQKYNSLIYDLRESLKNTSSKNSTKSIRVRVFKRVRNKQPNILH